MNNAKALHSRLNALIATDTRPVLDQNAVSRHTGVKRSTIKAAAVGAAPVTQLYETLVANMGSTTTGALLTTPIDPLQIHQLAGVGAGQGATCWILGPILSLALHAPTLILNNFLQIDSANVLVLGMWQGYPVAIHMTLEISTAYNQGSDARPELVLKAIALLRSATWQLSTGANMANDDYGQAKTTFDFLLGGSSTMTATNFTADAASLAAGKLVCLATGSSMPANAPSWFVLSHIFTPHTFSGTAGVCYMQQCWYGGSDFTVTQAQYNTPSIFPYSTTATIPSTPLVSPQVFGLGAQSIPSTPAAETIMQLGTLINLALSSASADSGIRLETRGGRPDFGFFPATEGGTIKFPVTVPTAGTYALMGAYSALGTVSMTASIGAESATYSLAPTGSWDVPQPWALTGIVLAAGSQTLTLTHHAGPQPDIFDCLTLVKTG